MKSSSFVHLHNHTHYSLLDGLQKVEPMIDQVKKMGMEAVAITDHGTMSGVVELYKTAIKKDVKPILGMEAYVSARKHTDKEPGKDKANYHLTLIAKNNVGYHNLMKLSTIANLEGFYYKPRMDHALLEEYSEGLIVLSGCIGGELGDAIRNRQVEKAIKIAKWYKKVFGENYYIELQDHGHPKHPAKWDEQVRVNKKLSKIASDLGIQCVITCDAHYLHHEDKEAHEILLCVQTGSFLDEESRMSLSNFDLHLADPKEIIARWGDSNPEAIKNTKKIADSCEVTLDLGRILIPRFPLPDNVTEKEYLIESVYEGLLDRYELEGEKNINKSELSVSDLKKLLPKDVVTRAEYELQIIGQMNFNGYFLIVADLIDWGKSQGIVFGPGRGSAAGSIISYALKITELDPLEYGLLFERFLNPDRISMPDVDIDIQDSRRDEVIQYCVDKYGEDRVSNIVTFGRMAARNAVRDVARVLRVPYGDADRLAKMIPPPIQGRHIPLAKSIKDSKELSNEYKNNSVAKEVFDLATKLEGTIRSHGVHAAGVVIAPDSIVNYVPLEKAQKGVVATQYPKGPVDELGLLKIDFLGLSNLTIINNALRIIKKVYKTEIDINTLKLDDLKTYEMLQKGDTTGVFQLESSGMKRYLKELKPTEFNDIVAMCALYRPGPLTAGLTDSFVKRKNGAEKITFAHDKFKDALSSTFGVLVYQEQVMLISTDVCGFTGGEADTLRKAIGKKDRNVMLKMKKLFIEGGEKHSGVPKAVMEKFWEDLMGFADYAFNKSHSACYGLIAYQTGYLKANFPDAYMAALMTSDYDNTDRLTIEMSECARIGISVLPPDVNESFVEFAIVPGKDKIRFGMSAIKNVGIGAVEEILRARKNGQFKSLEDFFDRVSAHVVSRKTMESLIKTGAFDRFESRSLLMNNIDLLIAYSHKKQKEKDSGQTDLFGDSSSTNHTVTAITLGPEDTHYQENDYLQWERDLMGLYLSDHPLEIFRDLLAEKTHSISEITQKHDGSKAYIGGIVNGVRVIQTKKGDSMAFVQMSDLDGDIELLLFPKVYSDTSWLWKTDKIVFVEGTVDAKDRSGQLSDEIKVRVSKAHELTREEAKTYKKRDKTITGMKTSTKDTDQKKAKSKRVYIRVSSTDDSENLILLKQLLNSNAGDSEVVLVVGPAEDKQIIRVPERISSSNESIDQLVSLFGPDNIKIA